MKFLGIKNNSSRDAFQCEPWSFKPQVPDFNGNKLKYIQWRQHPRTEHLVYTTAEGINPDLRPSKENPLKRLHGLVADYDAPGNDAFCDTLPERLQKFGLPVDLWPTWISRTFSGGARLIWVFEEPVLLDREELQDYFAKFTFKELLVNKWFPGCDEKAWTDLYKLYDVGTDWKRVKLAPAAGVRVNTLQHWLFEAAKKADWSKIGEIHIPIDIVAEEVDRQFPGRWQGVFEVGARGVAFFDPAATNPSAAIVTEAGMICFSQEKNFYSWAEIFGGSFIRRYQEDRIGSATRDTWFDGRSYFQKIGGVWQAIAKDDFAKWLNVNCGLNKFSLNNKPCEVSYAEMFVQRQRRVSGVIPRVYDTRDLIEINGLKYLNIAYVKPINPVVERQEWGDNFPWLAGFFDARFCDVERPFLFGWMQRSYSTALQGDLKKGQAFFGVGGVNLGKTLFSNKIFGALMGGFADASAYVTKGSEFNKQLLESGVWVIDDGEVAADASAHRRFSEVVKRVVANPAMSYRAMFRDAQLTTWNGRLVITLNDDSHSLAMIPDLEASMEEKVMILHFRNTPFDIPPSVEMIISRELPYFARWLLDYELPKNIVGGARFGIKGHINAELRDKALHAGGVSDVLEIVHLWFNRSNPFDKFGSKWMGSASEWVAEVSGEETIARMVSKYTVRQIGRKFVEASRIQGSGISVINGKGGNRFEIQLKAPRKATSDNTQKVSFAETAA